MPVVLVQLQVTVAAAPHATRGPNEALHDGAPPSMHVIDADAVAVMPSAPTALMVHISPAEPTLKGPEPTQGTGPLEGVEPMQT